MWYFKKPFHKNPRNGWKYKLDDLDFEGEGEEDLLKKVEHYLNSIREIERFAVIKQEMIDYFCVANPWMGRQKEEIETDSPMQQKINIDRWVNKMFYQELNYAAESDVKKRCKCCIKCEFNTQPIIDNEHFNKKIFTLARGNVKEDLGHCTKLFHDNRVCVLLEDYEPDNPEEVPGHCWLYKKPI